MNLTSIKLAANNIKKIFSDYLLSSKELEKRQMDLIKEAYQKEDEARLAEIRNLIKK
ncbi:MAG: hypothetical protein WCK37_02830 [Candidatus Falkowbacteria bacterium]